MRRGVLAVLLGLGLLGAGVVAVGYALPVGHVASREAALAQPPDRVFAVLAAVEEYPRWRSDVQSVQVLRRAPLPRWRERGRDGEIVFEMQESQPPTRLVARIADPDLPFGGTWTYVLVPHGAGTRLTITEHGEVYNPVFRFMSRFVFGHTAALERWLADLERRFAPVSSRAGGPHRVVPIGGGCDRANFPRPAGPGSPGGPTLLRADAAPGA